MRRPARSKESWLMRRGLVSIIAALVLLPGLPAAASSVGTPVVGPPSVEIPASPVGDQLAWVLAEFNGDATTLTEHDITARFAPSFLTQFLPAPALLDLMRQT